MRSNKERKGCCEENVSTLEKMEESCARFLEEKANEVWKSGDQESAQKGKKAARSVALCALGQPRIGSMARTYSLGRKQLIHGYKGIGKVIEHGKKHVGACSVLYAMRGAGEIRVGIVAGKSVGSAVQRNKAKRLLREAVRLNMLRIADGFEIVLIARKAIVYNTLRCIELDMLRLLNKAGCLSTQPGG